MRKMKEKEMKEGLTVEQLRDVGRIVAVVNSVAKALNSLL
jgi:hypothetical protein